MLRPVFWFAAFAAAGMVHAADLALMPMPTKVEIVPGRLIISAGFQIVGDPASVLAPVTKRYLGRVMKQTGIIPTPLQ